MFWRRSLVSIFWGICWFGVATEGIADRASPSRGVAVLVADREDSQKISTIVQAVRAQLSEFEIVVKTEYVDQLAPLAVGERVMLDAIVQRTDAILVFWYIWSGSNPSLSLYVMDAKTGELQAREIHLNHLDAMAETIAVIVRGAVEAAVLRADAEENQLPVADEAQSPIANAVQSSHLAPASEDVAHIPPRLVTIQTEQMERFPEAQLSLDAAYVLSFPGSNLQLNQGLAAMISVRIQPSWYLFAGYLALASIEHSTDDVQVKLKRHPIWLGGRFLYPFGRIALGGSLALNVDYVTQSATPLSSNVVSLKNERDLQMSLLPFVTGTLRLVRNVELFILVGAEFFFKQYYYSLATGTTREVVMKTWMIQPTAMIGLKYIFF